jgi:hypothetical protein
MCNKLIQNSSEFNNETFKIAYIIKLITRDVKDIIWNRLKLKSIN